MPEYTPQQAIEAFWEKVERGPGCWNFLGALDTWGYGQVRFLGRNQQASRVAWLLSRGSLQGKHVLHTCDNPACCNPDHMYLGGNAENGRDRYVRGRSVRGERVHSAKLTDEKVREIRRLRREEGKTAAELSAMFGIAHTTAIQIWNRKTWKHVE